MAKLILTRSRNASRRRISNQRHEIAFAAPRTDRTRQGKSTRGGKRAPTRTARKTAPMKRR